MPSLFALVDAEPRPGRSGGCAPGAVGGHALTATLAERIGGTVVLPPRVVQLGLLDDLLHDDHCPACCHVVRLACQRTVEGARS
jgi:hypothetical protein